MLDAEAPTVRGFYTLSASLIPLQEIPVELIRTLPRYDTLPVILLHHARHIGSMAVVVDAKTDAAERFYQHFNFFSFQQTPRRLFLPMRQIETIFD